MSRALTIHIVTSNAQTTLQYEHTIAKLATRHLTMTVRGEHVLALYPDWPRYETNTCHWYAQATLAALLGQSQTVSCVYLLTGLLISMPDSQKVM